MVTALDAIKNKERRVEKKEERKRNKFGRRSKKILPDGESNPDRVGESDKS